MLIIGSRGFLGLYSARAAAENFEVIPGNRSRKGVGRELQIDVRDAASVKAAFETARPDVVLLLAAISDIDRCEESPEEAMAVNVRGAEHVADACARSKVRLVFTSSAAVFDGSRHGYSEESSVNPVSVYGRTKANAEAVVLALGPQAMVLRIALAVGFAKRTDTNSLLDDLARRLAAGESVSMPVFERRNPIDAGTLSRFMLELVMKEVEGIFHVGCTEAVTRYELGLKFAARMGFSGHVQPQWEPTRGRAPRGPDHFLLTDKLRATCQTPVPSCEEVIERCFDGVA